MTEWEPATEAEAAMRDALRANDQELYFRILARTDLYLPVSAPAQGGQAAAGWGTWTTGGRTHVLAFTSSAALRACLGDNAGTTRRVPYADLAAAWPNPEWWLAVNPGLPVEGYLPAWFVAQLSRGDVRLPGRTLGARARLERAETLARARASGAGATRDASTGGDGDAPAAGLPGRTSSRATMPPTGGPPSEVEAAGSRVPAPAPAPAALPRRPAEPSDARHPSAAEARPAHGHPDPPHRPAGDVPHAAARPAPPPFAPADAPTDRRSSWPPRPDAAGGRPEEPGNGRATTGSGGRPGDEAPVRRSFFEPASGRGAAPGRPSSSFREPGRPSDRAAPPSRFGRGEQPFPRRRPLDAPSGAEPTQAFFAPAREPTPPPRSPADAPPVLRPPMPGSEATQPLPRRRPDPQAEEPTRAFSVPASAGRHPMPDPDTEVTQPLPPRRSGLLDGPEPAEELPPSVAEPVSGPPAPRRGFSPIVIEGTIIESRDLTDPPGAGPDAGGPPSGPNGAGPGPGSGNGRTGDFWGTARAGATAGGPGTTRVTDPREGVPAPAADPRGGAPAPAANQPGGGDAPAGTGRTGDRSTQGGGASDAEDLWTPRAARSASAGDSATAAGSGGGSAVGSGDPFTGTAAGPARDGSAPAPAGGTTAATDAPARAGGASAATETLAGSATGPAGGSAATTGHTTSADPVPAADRRGSPAAGGSAVPTATSPPEEPAVEFQPANAVEEDLLAAAGSGSTDTFLSTLLLARVLLPVAAGSATGSRPGEPGFVWRTEELDGETFVVVYTSPERLADHVDGEVETVRVRFVQLIRRWPDEAWSFAVNPGTPVGAKLPGEQIVGLANWAAEVGLGDDGEADEPPAAAAPAERPRVTPKAVDPTRPIVMQKAVAPSQLSYYLERGYDRVSGFVHRANELAHLNTPAQLHDALGLSHPGSPFTRDADEIYVLRWPAHRPSLYRIPYGGQNEAAMRAMEGWVIERPPFRGNGFAPGESSDVVAEFKVDSARLPHGAQLWRIGADGSERVVAVLDTDALCWREVGAE